MASILGIGVITGVGVAGTLSAPAPVAVPTAAELRSEVQLNPTPAVDYSQFDPSFIVSDAVLYNGQAMDAPAVQRFLDSALPACDPGAVCLKDYREDAPAREADLVCSEFIGGTQRTAAQIIAEAGKACGISQAALVVLLQKEQSLVTSTNPTPGELAAATGYACPDTADCDVNYEGFVNQVYWGAWQLARYANPPGTEEFFTWNPVNIPHQIGFNPDASCGAGNVQLATQATAALYYYTPYQPNSAVLAGSQTDECGAYGNLNFWRFFNQWFGDPRTGAPPTGAIDTISSGAAGIRVTGWSVDPTSEQLSNSVEVGLFRDGTLIAQETVTADRKRGQAITGFPLAGRIHEFTATVPGGKGGILTVCARALPLDIGAGESVPLGCSTLLAVATLH